MTNLLKHDKPAAARTLLALSEREARDRQRANARNTKKHPSITDVGVSYIDLSAGRQLAVICRPTGESSPTLWPLRYALIRNKTVLPLHGRDDALSLLAVCVEENPL